MRSSKDISEYLYLHKVSKANIISGSVISRLSKYSYFKTLLADDGTTTTAVIESLISGRLDALESMFTRVHDENLSFIHNSIKDMGLVNPQILFNNYIAIKESLHKIVSLNRASGVDTIKIPMDDILIKYGTVDHKPFLKEIGLLLDYSDKVVDLFYNIDSALDAGEVYAYLLNGLTKGFTTVDLCKNPDAPCYFDVGMLGKYFYLGIDPKTNKIVVKNSIIRKHDNIIHPLPEMEDLEGEILPSIKKLLERIGGIVKRIKTIPRHLERADVLSISEAPRWLLADNEDILKILSIIDFMNSNLATKTVYLNEYMEYIKQTVELREVISRD